MKKERVNWQEARKLACEAITAVGCEAVSLEDSYRRILAETVTAAENVPAFDRSPYDGYAFRAADVENASPDRPAILRIIEEIAAGEVSHIPVTEGTAVRLMTGAPIPEGADAVCKYEDTDFTETEVTLSAPVKSGANIVYAGEDVRRGTVLAETGSRIDTGVLGLLAAQRITRPMVHRVPAVGILSTGSELIEPGDEPQPGMISNTNRYTVSAAVKDCGCHPVYRGIVGDDPAVITRKVTEALEECDALVMTGGVSVGKYDYTMQALQQAGADILFDGVEMKPGMACAYGLLKGKLIIGLSGNPASALTNFYAVAAPALRKLSGLGRYLPEVFRIRLLSRFPKASPHTRFLRGTMTMQDGKTGIRLSEDQGNIILRSMVGSNVMAVIPAGSGPQETGTVLEGFLL